MPALRHLAERQRLAHLLGVPEDRLGFLRELDASALATLHGASRALLRASHRPLYRRLARASRLLPVSLAAWIAEHAMDPLLCGRIADEMSVTATAALCQHLSAAYMAAVCPHMDVDSLAGLTRLLPREQLREVCHHLLERGDYIVVGALVDALPEDIVQRMAQTFTTPETILRVSLFMEQPGRIEYLLSLLAPDDLPRLASLAAQPQPGLLPEALSLLHRVSPTWRRRLADAAIADGNATLAGLVREVDRLSLWSSAVPLTSLMDRAGRWKLLQLDVWRDADLRRRALRQAAAPRLLPHARALLGTLPADEREPALRALDRARRKE